MFRKATSLIMAGAAALTLSALPAAGQTADTGRQAIDPAWLKADAASKTATFALIAGLTGENGALNFNGYADGELTWTVPVGWNVVMNFSNMDGDLPHSAELIEDQEPLPPGPVEPAIQRAYTIKLSQGLQNGETDVIRFKAEKPGDYLIFCAVPGHGVAGMWIRFKVSDQAQQPTMEATPRTE